MQLRVYLRCLLIDPPPPLHPDWHQMVEINVDLEERVDEVIAFAKKHPQVSSIFLVSFFFFNFEVDASLP